MRNKLEKRMVLLLMLVLTVLIWQPQAAKVMAQGTATVKVENGLIREKANPSSTVLASVNQNDSLDVVAQTTGTDGYTWYKVLVDSQRQGYIRGDLVSVQGTISTESASDSSVATSTDSATTGGNAGNVTLVGSNNDTSTTGNTGSAEAAAGQVTPSQVATARVKEAVNVRAGAGTNYNKVTSAAVDTQVNVSGQATDTEGKIWYQVAYTMGGNNVNGYIREDFLEILEMVPQEPVEEPVVEEPVVEEPVVEQPVNTDYQLQYLDNGNGEMDWYLFNNIEGTSQSLTELLEAVRVAQENAETENGQVSTMKIVIAILAVALVILVVVVTLLLFKLRDSYEYYEEEEELPYEEGEEEEEEELLYEEEEIEEDDEEIIPIRGSRTSFLRGNEGREVKMQRTLRETEDLTATPQQNTSSTTETRKNWKSKDFLEMDDDMEFEFLDL